MKQCLICEEVKPLKAFRLLLDKACNDCAAGFAEETEEAISEMPEEGRKGWHGFKRGEPIVRTPESLFRIASVEGTYHGDDHVEPGRAYSKMRKRA